MCRAALRGADNAYRASERASDVAEQVERGAARGAAKEAAAAPAPWRVAPMPALKGDPVIQIGFTTRAGRERDLRRTALVLGTCDAIDGVVVKTFDDEAALLRAFAAEVRAADPDFVTGYNVMGFDFAYVRDRARELRVPDADMEMGRDGAHERGPRRPLFVEVRTKSAAFGEQTIRYYDMPGRVVFDLMKLVKREHKLSSYKLDAVAQHFTGDRKDDLSPADIFRMHAQGPAERATVARYCVQDCALVSELVDKLHTLENALGMADVCLVPTAWIFLRGQGCKVLSLVAKRCRLDGFAMPEMRQQEADEYDGALVLPPRSGVYDAPVAVLDFASLYPSSMIATNLSHDTMLRDDQPDPPGVAVEAVTFKLRGRAGERLVTRRFVQAGADGRHEGVLPRTLKTLLASRAAVRKRIKALPGGSDFEAAVLNGLQLAYKVTANSLYGQLGAATSDICCVDIAAATTAIGRSMLLKLRDFIENERGGDVVYGDSVAGYTPVFVREGGRIRLDTVEGVAAGARRGWVPCAGRGRDGKESLELTGVEVWSDAGWTRAHRLIRHRLQKRLLRVTTGSGEVDVTEDHSLLRDDGSPVKPGELAAGDRLLHADPPDFGTDATRPVSAADARVMGFIMGGDPHAAVPIDVLRSREQVRLEFLRGLRAGDSVGHLRTQLSAASVFALAASVLASAPHACEVLQVRPVRVPPSDVHVYDFTTDCHRFAAGVGRIVVHNTDSCFMLFPKACRGLEPGDALRATIAEAQACSDAFRPLLPPPQNAEYEKTFRPFVLIEKKRYFGHMYEDDAAASPKLKSLGIVLQRRDNAAIVKRVYSGAIERLMDGADVDGAADFVRARMRDLVEERVPLADLVVSKNLGGEYANPDGIAHAVLARRMAERDPGSEPAVGERVPYVHVVPDVERRGALQGERIEHADHVGGAKIDYEHYITNQVMNPIAQLFGLVVTRLRGCRLTDESIEAAAQVIQNECPGDPEKARKLLNKLRETEAKRLLFDDALAACARRRQGMRPITSYMPSSKI